MTCTNRFLLIFIVATRRRVGRFPRATIIVVIIILKIESLYMRSILGFLGFIVLLGGCGVRIVDGCDCFLIKAVALYSAASIGLRTSCSY